ncbi:MAG TPA: hypothetical protein VFL98_00705 [Candidatus Paceibacterota bacterium]|nr:hypothetical protein [Candidatus Paceibacterota bacterium]
MVGSTCSGCTSQTFSYSNGNGTYSTITTFSQSNISGSGNHGGNHGGTPPGSGSCPVGTTRQSNGSCVPTLPGGGTPVPGSCPAGTTLQSNGTCVPTTPNSFCFFGYTLTGQPCDPGVTKPPVCPLGYTMLPNGSCQPAEWGTCQINYSLLNGSCVPPVGGSPKPPSCPSNETLQPDGTCIPYQGATCSALTIGQNGGYCPTGTYPYLGHCYPQNQCRTGSTNHNFNAVTCYGMPVLSCTGGTQTAPAKPAVSISAKPALVRTGESTTLSWNGINAAECTISGTDGFLSHEIAGTATINDVTDRRVYTITCDNGGPSVSASTTVSILPVWQEI